METTLPTTEVQTGVPPLERPMPKAPPLRAFWDRFGALIITLINLSIFVYIWQSIQGGANPIIDTRFVPTPTSMVRALFKYSGQFVNHAAFTATHYGIGMLISIGVGIPVGILVGLNPLVRSVVMTYVWIGYTTPNIAIQPIIVVILGFGIQSKIFLVILMAIFPILVNVISGVATVDPVLLKAGHLFGANWHQQFRKIIIPSTLPWIMTGVRLAARRGLMGAIVAEIFGSIRGLAYVVIREAEVFNSDKSFAAILILMAISLLIINGFAWIEQKATPWRIAYKV
jgi:taurine transport system permease protein